MSKIEPNVQMEAYLFFLSGGIGKSAESLLDRTKL